MDASASRRRSGSAVGSRSVSERRQEPPPTSFAERASCRGSPARPLRAGEQALDERRQCPRERELVRHRLREGERLGDLGRRPARLDGSIPLPLASGELPCFRSVRAEPVRDRTPGQAGQLAETLDPELRELLPPLRREREEVERERLEEEVRLAVVDDERPAGRRHGRRRQRREAPGRRPHTSPPLLPDRVERPPERLLEPSGQPLHPPRLEVDAARLDRLDRKAGLLEPPQHGLPGLLHPGRILLDQLQLRAHGERLGEAHPRPNTRGLSGAGAGAEQRPRPRHRRERDGLALQLGPPEQRSPEGEARNRETGDHGNVCSTRTHVLLSRQTKSLLLELDLGQKEHFVEPEGDQLSIGGAASYSSSTTWSPQVAGLPSSSTSSIAMWVMKRVGAAPCQ